LPSASDEMLNIALPAPTKFVPREVAPSKNSTVPPGTKAPVTDTVAKRVTCWPTATGLASAVMTVEVACAKALPAPPTRQTNAVANIKARRAQKIRSRTATNTQRNCDLCPDAGALPLQWLQRFQFPVGNIKHSCGTSSIAPAGGSARPGRCVPFISPICSRAANPHKFPFAAWKLAIG
jgi:hypothetical protein